MCYYVIIYYMYIHLTKFSRTSSEGWWPRLRSASCG